MIELKELDHFGIEVSDLDRARRFYCEVLGAKFLRPMGPAAEPDGLLLRCGTRNFALHRNSAAAHDGRAKLAEPRGKAHLAFRVTTADFETAIAQFGRLDIPFTGPIDWGDHTCLYFLDPDGNLLELTNRWTKGLSWLMARLRR